MTVRVIEQGQRAYPGKCPECACVFQYERSDIQGVTFKYVLCPNDACRTRVPHHGATGAR